MKQFCKYSGVNLQTSNYFHNLLKSKEFYSVSSHQIFDYPIGKILDISTRKPIEAFTGEERHLLFLSLLNSHGNILIEYPIKPSVISSAFIISHWETLFKSSISIASFYSYWTRAIESGESPFFRITREIIDSPSSFQHSLHEWIGSILPNTITFLKQRGNKRDVSTLWDEVELERKLRLDLLSERVENRKHNKYTSQMGIYVFKKIKSIESQDAQQFLTIPFLHMCESVLKTNTPKDIKFPISAIKEIIDFIDRFLNPQSNHKQKSETEWKNPLDRNYILFTVAYLHNSIQYFNDMYSLFENITDNSVNIGRIKENLMSNEFNSPIEFTLHTPKSQLEAISVNNKKAIVNSPAMQRLLAKVQSHNANVIAQKEKELEILKEENEIPNSNPPEEENPNSISTNDSTDFINPGVF